MAIIKCKMCGGDLVLTEGSTIATCEYCGSQQTVPTADNEKKLTLFARANRLRMGCEFDKAAGVYESIVADFPEEAEAYWGLVLCKYGIEYVDDPATGNKIPTCHRSSFESIMDDSDLEQALENADLLARRQYRDEAKQIEEIRKGIIAVSANEQPYDIFICYKETDANGDRTLDSVLAQDIYDALTAKNYRVFFSRITLEDKLGVEFEPYIFAALSSAKIMLAVGTDYEYYNAVWVKNEWSRYLKLMAKDKGKHLIPCFKGIDAYDMPKEFARLQAQDLGKVGAIQDLLRGIEKILPKNQPVTVVQEKVVVGGSGNNKIASLLDRGNMALEDGDWAKADSFFEDVLNNDSKNAQAYLGKTLAQEKCRTVDAFVRKRKGISENAKSENLHFEPNHAHIEEIAEKYAIGNYLDKDTIRRMYDYDLSYSSRVADRKEQYRSEESYWANHKLLSRAEKFAVGAVAENLTREKKALFAALSDRVKQAESAEKSEKEALLKRYSDFLKQTDAEVEKRYRTALNMRETNYENWLKKAKEEKEPEILKELEQCFIGLGDFRDSKSLAEHCHKRAEEQRARIEAAQEAERIRWEKQRATQKKKKKMLTIVAAVAAVLAIAVGVVIKNVMIPKWKYDDALAMMDAGLYEEAIAAFEALGDYEDSAEKIPECQYRFAVAKMETGEYETAIAIFEELGDYNDSKKRIKDSEYGILLQEKQNAYLSAIALMEAGEYDEAITVFQNLKGYEDSLAQIQICRDALAEIEYREALQMLDDGQYQQAALALGKLGDYQDARVKSLEAWSCVRKQTTISAKGTSSSAVKSDGTAVSIGFNSSGYGEHNVGSWRNLVSISSGFDHTVGLKEDGTVIAIGRNDDGRCNVGDWSDIVAISAGAHHTVGLKADGTVVAVGWNQHGQCDVSYWSDIVAISAGMDHTIGLKADGTVVAVGGNGGGQCRVKQWSDIVAISAGHYATVGLKADGTVVSVGWNNAGECNLDSWQDIVAVSAGVCITVGLKTDGTVVTAGADRGNLNHWKNIIAISAGSTQILGLKSDGTVVAVGENEYGECNVGDWTDIMIP